MDKDLSGKVKRLLWKAELGEPGIQEQAARELVFLIKAAGSPDPTASPAWPTALELLVPPRASLVTASVITQGLVLAVTQRRLGNAEVTKALLGAAEAVAQGTEDPALKAVQSLREGGDTPVGPLLEDTTHAYLNIYVAGLADLSRWLVGGREAEDPASLPFGRPQQLPLESALSLKPSLIATPVFHQIVHLPQLRPPIVLSALVSPIATSLIYQPELRYLVPQLISHLYSLHLEYLPEATVAALCASCLTLAGFTPWQTLEDASWFQGWVQVGFRCLSQLENTSAVMALGREASSLIVTHALMAHQGGQAFTFLPLVSILHQLAEYDPSLVSLDFPTLAFLALGTQDLRERDTLLATIRLFMNSILTTGQAVDYMAVAWVLPSCLGLASLDDQSASRIVVALEKAQVVQRLLASPLRESGAEHSPQPDPFWSDTPGHRWSSSLYMAFRSISSATDAPLRPRIDRLRRLVESRPSPPSELLWATWVLSTHLFHPCPKTRSRAMSLLPELQQAHKLVGLRALPSVLYALEAWPEPELRMQLLGCLPLFGRHQLGAQMVQSIFRRLHSLPSTAEKRLRAVTASLSLRLATRLFALNTRTLPRLSSMLVADGQGLTDELDEVRLARAQAMLEVIMEDPEAGTDFVASLQRYLKDEVAAVISLAIEGLTLLCTADCLEYLAAVRILGRKGRVGHLGDPLVMASLADLYGAATVIFDTSPEVEDTKEGASEATAPGTKPEDSNMAEDEEPRPRLPEKWMRILVDNLWELTSHDDARVRRKAFEGLSGFVPALLGSEEAEVAQTLRDRLLQSLLTEEDDTAREGLVEVVKMVLITESEDSATWRSAMKLGLGTASGSTAKPSRKALKNMPSREELVGLYSRARSAGLAGAVMLASTDIGVKSLMEAFMDALSDEDSGGRCYIQRLMAPVGFLRLVPILLKALKEEEEGKGMDEFGASVAAVEVLESIIKQEMAREGGARDVTACYLALASLANSLPQQLFHKAEEFLTPLLSVLKKAATSIAVDVPALLVSIALVSRSLGPSNAHRVHEAFSLIVSSREALAVRTDAEWCLWGLHLSLGALTDWVSQQYSPDEEAITLLKDVCRVLIGELQYRARSRALASLLQQGAFAANSWRVGEPSPQRQDAEEPLAIVAYQHVDLSPSPPWLGSELATVGACLGLSVLANNLAHCGMERQLLQLYHVSRALALSGGPGSNLLLVATAPLCLRLGLLQSSDIFEIFRHISTLLDAGTANEDAILGLANLVVGVEGLLALPIGYIEDLRGRLLVLLGNRDTEHGRRVAATMALYTLLASGGPCFSLLRPSLGAGMSQDKTLSSAMASFVDRLRQTMDGPSQRCRNSAARVMGLLVALRYSNEKQGDGRVGQATGAPVMAINRLEIDSFGLPGADTLIHGVLQEMINLAVGGLDSQGATSPAMVTSFITSVLSCLEECPTLRFTHRQMVLLLQNFLRASRDIAVTTACISFAITSARRDASYVTWLYDVTINATLPTAIQVLLRLDKIIKIIPPGLVRQLLVTLWGKLPSRKYSPRYEHHTVLLSKLAQCFKVEGKPTSGSNSTAATEPSSSKPFVPGLTQFATDQVLGHVRSQDFQEDLRGSLEGCEKDASPRELLDALAGALAGLLKSPDMIKAFSEGKKGDVADLVLDAYMACQLVSRGALPITKLADLRLWLVGPGGVSPPHCRWSLLALVMCTLVERDSLTLHKEWALSLLDYLLVKPQDTTPLVVLSCLLAGWYPTHYSYLLPDVFTSWEKLRDALQSVCDGANPVERHEHTWVLWMESSFVYSLPLLLNRLSGEGEAEVVSRVVRILATPRPPSPGSAFLKAAAMSLLRGARSGRAVRLGHVPRLQTVVSDYCIEVAQIVAAACTTTEYPEGK